VARVFQVGGIEVTAVDLVLAEARLRDIQSLTDAVLSRLDDRDLLAMLLAMLLDRVREISGPIPRRYCCWIYRPGS
jgi:hypothetical protein